MANSPPVGYRRGLRAVIALQCLLILAFVYRGLSAPGPFGPRLPAVQGQTVWLESHGALHQFNAAGQRLQHIALDDLQLSPHVSSLQFTQPNIFWVHDESRVQRCDLQQRRCLPIELADLGTRRESRWVRVSDDESEITVSDASMHRVLVYRRDAITARYTLAHSYAEGLRFPNQTLQSGDGMWVANTNRHQIVQLRTGGSNTPAGAAAAPARREITTQHDDLRPGRQFPFAMALGPQGRLWVLVADSSMQRADVLILNRQMQPERVIPVSATQDPNAITRFQQHMLLTDMSNFTVRRMDEYGRVLEPFGDADFRAELATASNRAQWAKRLPTLLLTSIGVLMLIGLWLAWKAGELNQLRGAAWRAEPPCSSSQGGSKPLQRAAGNEPLFAAGRVSMVKAKPGSTRTRRRMMLIADAAVIVIGGALVYWAWPRFYQQDCSPGAACGLRVPLLLGAVVLLPLLASQWARRQLKSLEMIRIGTDGEQVQAQVGKKRYNAPTHKVTCTRQRLLIGWGVVPLRLNGEPLFDEDALRVHIIDRLPQMTMHNSVWNNGLLTHYWRHGGWRGRGVVVAMTLLLGLIALRVLT